MRFINGEWKAEENTVEAKCLNNIATRERKIEKKSSPKLSQEDIRNENRKNPYYAYAYDLVEHIKIMMEATDFNNIIFRNKRSIAYYSNKKQIQAGYWYFDDIIENGFHEYISVQQVWIKHNYNPYRKMTGKKAVWAIVLHEMAHHFQTDRTYGSVHNDNFREKLEELIILFPFDEVQYI